MSATSVFPAPVGAATITLLPSRIACAARAWNGKRVLPRKVHVPSTFTARGVDASPMAGCYGRAPGACQAMVAGSGSGTG